MNNIERYTWVENLCVGDTVVNLETVNTAIEGLVETKYVEYKVKNITKTGRIRLDNNVLLDRTGRNIIKGFKIEPITEEIEKELTERKAYCGFKYNTLMSMLAFVDTSISEWTLVGTPEWKLLEEAVASLEKQLGGK